MADILEIAVKERKVFRVDGSDFVLTFPVAVVVELEIKLGHSMKTAIDWLNIKTSEVRDILEAGFRRYHRSEAGNVADAICEALDPEEISTVIDGICAAACPKAVARIQEQMAKARERIQKGLPALPNAPGADVR
jgi:hypothetical protein